jgi:hypothetical protein
MNYETTTIFLTAYENRNYYWEGYSNQEVKLEMIQYVIKDAGYAFSYGTDFKKLYQIVLKDGNKLYTDLGGYRKIINGSKKLNLQIQIKE